MPDFDSLFQSAVHHHRAGNLSAAISLYQQAAQLRPQSSAVYNNLSLAFKELGDAPSALASARHAVQLAPDKPGLHTNLGNLYRDLQDLDAAIDAYRRTLALDPGNIPALNNLALAFQDSGLIEDAISTLRRAVDLDPNAVMAHSNLLYAMHFDPRFSARDLLAEHRIWAARHAEALTASAPPHTNDRNPDRPLRLGYVSSHLYDHVVGRFMLPLLKNHDRRQFHVICYTDQLPARDDVAHELQSAAQVWRNTRGQSDVQLSELIRQDRVDILVDLTMHMAGSRLLAFARKPAPVQLTYLSYASTTGLSAIDFRLTDPYLDPPGTDADYTERSVRLPDCWWCYQPPASAGDVNLLPALSENVVTFSALNTFAKVTPEALKTWASVLRAVPRSRLLLHAREGSHRRRVLDLFARERIHPERVNFIGFVSLPQYFDLYRLTDIALDPFPWAGGTTTFDALWTGVPVVTLAGQTAVGRGGASILHNLHLPDLIGTTPDHYVQIATSLATDLPRVAALRQSLRPMLQSSPLTNAPRIAAQVESAYRQIWRAWCASHSFS